MPAEASPGLLARQHNQAPQCSTRSALQVSTCTPPCTEVVANNRWVQERSQVAVQQPVYSIGCSERALLSAHNAGACYEEIIDVLARRAMAAAAVAAAGSSAPGRPACRRHVVGVAGAPGSGKSTLAVEIMQRINALAVEAAAAATAEAAAAADGEGDGQQAGTQVALQGPRAVVLPMDGFHYYRRELDAMPDPKVGSC